MSDPGDFQIPPMDFAWSPDAPMMTPRCPIPPPMALLGPSGASIRECQHKNFIKNLQYFSIRVPDTNLSTSSSSSFSECLCLQFLCFFAIEDVFEPW